MVAASFRRENMKATTRTTGGLAILALMLTGSMANAQTGNKKSANPPASPAATDSAANQKKAKSTGGMQGAQSNPMYKDNKNEGTNPLYGRTVDDSDPSRHHPSENKTTIVQPPANNVSHETAEYKDPEDMTTRYRPGNNKTTKTVTPVGPPSSPNVVEYKDGEDGTTHTRPSNPK
jgi:hypothetical protein